MMIENYRKEILKYLFSVKSFSEAWEKSWKNKIQDLLQDKENITEEKLIKIGENAREMFLTTGGDSRGQGDVSSAGTAWESFLAWYLNLGLIGTRTLVLKPKKEFNFKCIQNVVSVNYGEFISSSETDLIAITFPKKEEVAYTEYDLKSFEGRVFSISELQNPQDFNLKKMNEYLNRILENNISKIKINVIQCKTNWNDNAQIPMGWDMIYSSTGFTSKDISIGKDGFSIHKVNEFKYSFITVPTQKDLNTFKETSTSVLRVKRLSGKNFWGAKTKDNVAQSIGDIFNENFKESFNEIKFEKRIKIDNLSEFKLF